MGYLKDGIFNGNIFKLKNSHEISHATEILKINFSFLCC